MVDYYEVLDVPKSATQDEIKKAYRKKALQFHPDRNAGDPTAEKKFKEISEAYDILGDEQKRQTYDRYGADAFQGGHPGHAGQGFSSMEEALRTFMGAFGGGTPFGDVFGGAFGGDDTSSRQQGASKRLNVSISFVEAIRGVDKEVTLASYVVCDVCKGKRTTSAKGVKKCSRCGGAGQMFEQRGFFSMAMTCSQCHGEGQTIVDPCSQCHGEGRVKSKRKVHFHIPAGIDTGMRLKLNGYGDVGVGGAHAGDLFVYVTVESHELFERQGSDIILEVPITFSEAALGCKKEIPSFHSSTISLSITPGTQSGKIFRVKGEGFPGLQGGRGDLLARVVVETPSDVTKEQKKILEALAGTESPHSFPKSKGFFDKIKDLLSC